MGYFMSLDKRFKSVIQAVKYLFAGGSAAIIELSIFFVLSSVLTFSPVILNLVAVAISTAYNFAFNRSVTFRSSGNMTRSLVLYVVLLVFNTIFSSTVIAVLGDWGVTPIIAKILSMCCTVIWNYFLYRNFIFK